MSFTRREIAKLWAYYTSLFVELNAESKCSGEISKFCMCDPYDVFHMLLKIEKLYNKIIFFIYTKLIFLRSSLYPL